MPTWFYDVEDAKILGVHPWELHKVPIHWREKARAVNLAKKQALQDIAKSSKAQGVYILEL